MNVIKKSFIFTKEDYRLINWNDDEQMDIGILEVVN